MHLDPCIYSVVDKAFRFEEEVRKNKKAQNKTKKRENRKFVSGAALQWPSFDVTKGIVPTWDGLYSSNLCISLSLTKAYSLASRENWLSLKRNETKVNWQSKYFHLHCKTFCSQSAHSSWKSSLTCPLLRPKEDICILVFIYCNVFSTWGTSCKKVCQCNNILEQYVGKQRRLERKFCFFGISEAELLRFYCVNLFSLQGQCRAQFRLIIFF